MSASDPKRTLGSSFCRDAQRHRHVINCLACPAKSSAWGAHEATGIHRICRQQRRGVALSRARSARNLFIVGVVSGRSREADERSTSAFYKGLSEAGYVDGQNVTVEYHWLEGKYDRLPALMAEDRKS